MSISKDPEPESVKIREWRQLEQNKLSYMEDVFNHPLEEQEKILKHILKKNGETEYLRKFELNGATDAGTFRARLPVSDYDLYKPYVERIYGGDTSPVLCADRVIAILTSSGTSRGEPKLYAVTEEDMDRREFFATLMKPLLNRAMPGLENGKSLFLYMTRTSKATPGGLPCNPVSVMFLNRSAFKARLQLPSNTLTSPYAVILATKNEESMYCHLLLGLLQREEVLRFGAIFSGMIQKAMRFLEESWQDLCDDIASGGLNQNRVKAEAVRATVLPMVRRNPELAELVRSEFAGGKATAGIIRRLWPNVKVVDTICTGTMEAYISSIAHYTDNLPVINNQMYASTEASLGLNMDPLCSPEKVCYTLIPSSAYYEFITVKGSDNKMASRSDEILDLMSLKEEEEYELIVTTVSGLYRYRMGDILKVVGFYNSTPTFQFMRRMNIVLSIDNDKTDENELHNSVNQGMKFLERELGLRLLDYTSTPDFSSKPGHYVIFWELVPITLISSRVLEQCCGAMEASLNFIYRRGRHENIVGPLELRLVQEGTFDKLTNYAISQGATFTQYKTPRGIDAKKTAVLDILSSQVYQRAFAPGKPPFDPVDPRHGSSSAPARVTTTESETAPVIALENKSSSASSRLTVIS